MSNCNNEEFVFIVAKDQLKRKLRHTAASMLVINQHKAIRVTGHGRYSQVDRDKKSASRFCTSLGIPVGR